ncbi:hypothetical protein BKA57DRAFT_453523 [Linnemannia elongata]|nr:hypothetical protein BGZ88_003429 [Linnemannia elongata]KAF9335514.1 hypothetical protein BGZ91_010460 [Linnemannia elongata]KAG0068464.1 hypothetical protein BGZ90_000573 [Linnemannia elongata]KAG0069115.1 hypothetical protein BGZ89_003511 [Linnemannia elongata]KAH7055320.1 hypothetical protein BKA57DRAFT_453523 [Linnemannia elongata]
MSCDLTDPAILEAYQDIISGTPTNWLILGYHDTRDKISLYSRGTGGIDELTSNLKEEVLYGFVRIEDRFALLAYVSEQVSGLRRARALVHGKAVGALFKASNVQINTSSLAELTEERVRTRLGLIDGPPTPEANSPVMPSTPIASNGSPVPAPRPATPVSPAPVAPASSSPAFAPATVAAPVAAAPIAIDTLVQQSVAEVPSSPSPVRTGSPRSGLSTPRTERQMEIEAAERKVREEMERQRRAEAAKRQRETEEREAREQELFAQKQALELERKRKEESDRIAREAMKKQLIEMERLRGSGLSGYLTIQVAGSPFWKRRFYVMQGQTVSLYRDEIGRAPIMNLKVGGQVVHIADASLDVLIPNSFRIDLKNGDSHYFFSDSTKDKEMAIAGFMKCNESA